MKVSKLSDESNHLVPEEVGISVARSKQGGQEGDVSGWCRSA